MNRCRSCTNSQGLEIPSFASIYLARSLLSIVIGEWGIGHWTLDIGQFYILDFRSISNFNLKSDGA